MFGEHLEKRLWCSLIGKLAQSHMVLVAELG